MLTYTLTCNGGVTCFEYFLEVVNENDGSISVYRMHSNPLTSEAYSRGMPRRISILIERCSVTPPL